MVFMQQTSSFIRIINMLITANTKEGKINLSIQQSLAVDTVLFLKRQVGFDLGLLSALLVYLITLNTHLTFSFEKISIFSCGIQLQSFRITSIQLPF